MIISRIHDGVGWVRVGAGGGSSVVVRVHVPVVFRRLLKHVSRNIQIPGIAYSLCLVFFTRMQVRGTVGDSGLCCCVCGRLYSAN